MSWLMGLSPWLQVLVILAVAAPACGAAGYALVRGIDVIARRVSRR